VRPGCLLGGRVSILGPGGVILAEGPGRSVDPSTGGEHRSTGSEHRSTGSEPRSTGSGHGSTGSERRLRTRSDEAPGRVAAEAMHLKDLEDLEFLTAWRGTP